MKCNSNDRADVTSVASIALALLSISASSPVRSALAIDDKPEKFEKIDPYTRGQRKELDRAGYISLGPFPLAEGIKTGDVEEVFGSIPVLWVETAHFKLGSTLVSYPISSDERERRALHEELVRLGKRLPNAHDETAKLDPWLRLHLYAQRLEEEYADFESRFALSEDNFTAKANPDPRKPDYMGPGPFLGAPMKFTVLLTEKSSHAARFAKHWLNSDETTYYEALLPGGSVFLGVSAEESKKSIGTSLDSALHGIVAQEVARNLCAGFRGARARPPAWFAHGLALYYGRKVDERWCLWVPRARTDEDDGSWRWELRMGGLVANNFVQPWEDMLAWPTSTKLEVAQHMTAWSRVSWLMTMDKARLRTFLMGVSQGIDPKNPATSAPGYSLEQQKTALNAAFGKTPVELDTAWRKWVARTYPRK
jgi:hypothetical protein